ncbi:beta-ketoacyl synthase N-terminal-like domain-containing protein [Streptomyces sp. NPDC127584]|uniref:beta-ketoacyl synthase N-terminal-like domain-containing protein n=1 Tax=Streptomyces sp. NPDC127584 TaxID=3345403 RepID=UPI003637C8D4
MSELDTRIAVIGLATRLPGAEDVADLTAMLGGEGVEVGEVPPSRWARDLYLGEAPHRGTHHRGAFLVDPFSFDHEAFGMTAEDAVLLDPQQRVMLEVGARALEDSGYLGARRRLDAGVFVGARMNAYGFDRGRGPVAPGLPDPATAGTGPGPAALWGRSQNFMAAWLSDRFDLAGPSLVVDTACSSSLSAVWLACQSLASGSCEIALVGAVDLLIDPLTFVLLSRTGALSPDGLCHTFDRRANGYVPGEGAAALVLKPMAAALRDGDLVLGAISGVAVNNDGRTMGVTTPNLEAQIDLLDKVYRTVDPATVQYVEAHGTGTAIGDPIEVRALTEVFGRHGVPRNSVALGSVKRRIGHLHSASGLAGLAKIILSLREGTVPAVAVESPNPRLNLDDSPFDLPEAPRPWPDAPVRRAAVSGFGFGGTNAHVVAEAVPAPARGTGSAPAGARQPAHVLTLSADTAYGLRELCAQWVEFLPTLRDRPEELADVCATARLARPHRAARLAVVGEDADALTAALRARLLTPGATGAPGAPGAAAPAGTTRATVSVRPEAAAAPPAWLTALDRSTPAVHDVVRRFETATGTPLAAFSGELLRILSGVALAIALRDLGLPDDAVDLPPGWDAVAAFVRGSVPLEQALGDVLRRDGDPARDAGRPDTAGRDVGARLAGVHDERTAAAVLAAVAADLFEAGRDIDWGTFQKTAGTAWSKRLLPVAQQRGRALNLAEPLRSAEPGSPAELVDDGGPAGYTYARVFSPGEAPIAQHSVYRTLMLPGVAWFDFLREGAALRGEPFHGALDVLFHRPLIPAGARRVVGRVDGDGRFRVEDGETGDVFVTGRLATRAEPAPRLPVGDLLADCAGSAVHAGSGLYRWLRRIGYHHGRYYRNISWVASLPDGGTLARIEGPRQRELNPTGVQLFPGLLDSVTVAAIDPANPVFGTADASAFIPLSVGRLDVLGPLDEAAYVRTEIAFWNDEACRVTQTVTDESGTPLLVFGDMASKRVPALAFREDTATGTAPGASADPGAPVTPAASTAPQPSAVPAASAASDRSAVPAAVPAPPVAAPVPAVAAPLPVEPAPAADAPAHGAPAAEQAPAAFGTPSARALAWFLALTGTSEEHADTEFLSAGFDSVGLVALSERISQEHDLSLYPTVFFEYATPRQFADFLTEEAPELVDRLPSPSTPDAPPAAAEAAPAAPQSPAAQPVPTAPAAAEVPAAPVTPVVPAPAVVPAVQVPPIAEAPPVAPSAPRPAERPQEPAPVARLSAVPRPRTADEAAAGDGRAARARDIAVVGAAVRLPTAGTLADFAELLVEGRDTVGPLPETRRGDVAGPLPHASFLDRVDAFDPAPFRISAREAPLIDPQARIVYETIWEALEDGGRGGARAAADRTGLWIAYSHDHYHEERFRHGVPEGRGLGLEAMIANRLSYLMDWRGPSTVVNTLCSSSLVALHSALQHLRSGDIDTAVIGAVHAGLSPEYFRSMGDMMALSPRHRSRAFDSTADGFVPGEGAVAVVLRRCDDALRDGDRIRGVVKGAAVNHGGRTTRYSAPSPRAQAEVISAALVDAGVSVESIGLVEAHGTGTSLGDPIEVEGLTRAWRGLTGRSQFCALGSLKGNVGHLEPAAGLAGLVKVLLSMERGVVPPSLHVVRPNDHIRFEGTPFFLADRVSEWPRPVDGPRRGAVSAFGMGGVNAHVILEEAPAAAAREVAGQESYLVRVDAADETSVRALAGSYADALAAADENLVGDFAFTANTGRAENRFGTVVSGGDAGELAVALRDIASGAAPVARRSGRKSAPVVFMFTGQGSQYTGMSQGLYRTEPAFRAALDECADLLAGHLDIPLLDLLFTDTSGALGSTRYAQVGIVSVQVALVRWLESLGVRPDVVVGHSLGELSAGWAAGVVGLEDLLRLAVVRGQLMESQPGEGAMAAVHGDAAAVVEALKAFPGVEVAAFNSPRVVTVSGPVDAVARFRAESGLRSQPLVVSHAFHSALMEGAVAPFAEVVSGVEWSAPRVAFASTVLGGWHTPESVKDAGLWARGIREPVRFSEAVGLVSGVGAGVVWEIGAQPQLTSLARASWSGDEPLWLSTLRRDRVDQAEVYAAVAAYAGTGSVDWSGVHAGKGHRTMTLPTYPFNRQRYWITPSANTNATPAPNADPTPPPPLTPAPPPIPTAPAPDPALPNNVQHPHHTNERYQHHG